MNDIRLAIRSIIKGFDELLFALRRPPAPGPLALAVTGEINREGTTMLQYKITLPPPAVSDIVNRLLTVDGVGRDLPGDTLEAGGYEGDEGATVVASLIDTDNAGNLSPAREATFTLVDTISPPVPGELGLVVTGET